MRRTPRDALVAGDIGRWLRQWRETTVPIPRREFLRRAGQAADGAMPWTFRATECDIAGHVNNAAYWQPLEEELLAGPDPEQVDAEVEYRAPAQPGAKRIVRENEWRWILGQDDELHASIAVAPSRV